MTTPEQLARQNIDQLLDACGWKVQHRSEMNLGAARGEAVRVRPKGFPETLGPFHN